MFHCSLFVAQREPNIYHFYGDYTRKEDLLGECLSMKTQQIIFSELKVTKVLIVEIDC